MNTKTSILMAKARRPLGCGVRKFGILLTVMAAAIIALPNTVTNDVVVATSDAELRISDRGLGLGLEVVGGGAAEVKLETRPGWRFRDGSTSVTLNKAAGEPAKSPAIEGEGNGAENYVPGVDVNDDESGDDENDEGSVDHEKPVLSLTATAPKVVAYSVLDGGTNVSISLSATVTTKGKHRKLDANGNVVKEEEFSPKRYVWKMTGAATGEAETDSSTHTFVVNLTKGKDKKLSFSVVGKICGICDGEVESDKATDSVEIDVYELSISRPDYLGLDRTDAGRQGHVVKTATLSSDPSLPSSSSVEWTECGICEFVGAKNQWSVSYQNKDSETASGEYLAERLAASVTLAGMDSSVVCATNFTVVKVDVSADNWGEMADESGLVLVPCFLPGSFSGKIKESVSAHVILSEILPATLKDDDAISLEFQDGEVVVKTMLGFSIEQAKSEYALDEFLEEEFHLLGVSPGDKDVKVTHCPSDAVDKIRYRAYECKFTAYSDCSELLAKGLKEVWGDISEDFGHSFWMLEIDAEHIDLIPADLREEVNTPKGFYPDGGGLFNVPGHIDKEADHEHYGNCIEDKRGTAQHTWYVTLEDCISALRCAKERRNAMYDLQVYNCTHAVIEVGEAASADVPHSGIDDIIRIVNPTGDLSELVEGYMGISAPSNYASPIVLYVNLMYLNFVRGSAE